MYGHVLYRGLEPSLVTGVLLRLVCNSLLAPLYDTIQHLQLEKAVEDAFVLVVAASHSDYLVYFLSITNTLTYLVTWM